MIHRRDNRDPGRHLVVQQSADFLTKNRGDLVIKRIVAAIICRVQASSQVAFQGLCDRNEFRLGINDDDQRGIAEGFCL